MAAVATNDRSEMMFLGAECHHSACHLHDFLPFSCPACHQTYCQPHFLPSVHDCKAPLPPSMVDRIAPQCPLCNNVVNTVPGKGPNEAVERHILSGTCVGFEGGEARRREELKRRKERGEMCWKKGCQKLLVVQMKCSSCGHQFCPSHRHTNSHVCSPSTTPLGSRTATPQPNAVASSSTGGNTSTKTGISRLLPPSMQPPKSSPSSSAPTLSRPQTVSTQPTTSQPSTSTSLDVRAAAAAAAMKRAGQDVKVPFVKTKTEKRANAEVQSQIQALKARHDKGLLTKAEELKYAELVGQKEASRRSGNASGSGGGKGGSKDKKDCVIA